MLYTAPSPRRASLARVVVPALLLLAGLWAGCESGLSVPDDPDTSDILSTADASLVISYDEKVVTTRTLWPGELVAGAGKGDGPNELLSDYRNTRERIVYDREGYLSSETVYVEGWQGLGMPEAMYQEFAEEMPAPDPGFDPVVRIVRGNKRYKTFGRSGKMLLNEPLKQERIPPGERDSTMGRLVGDVAARRARVLARLEAQGVAFDVVQERFAYTEEAPAAEDAADGVGGYRVVYDLEVGAPVRRAILDTQGRYRFVELSDVRLHDGFPVIHNKETYQYGELSGQWRLLSRTVTNRTNIEVNHR